MPSKPKRKTATRAASPKPELWPRFRIKAGKNIAFGPGKAELLALVAETGSIRDAAKHMEMSYMRAWTLVQTMNTCFREPVIATVRGGNARGGAVLTPTGRKVLALYQRMEAVSLAACRADWKRLQQLLRH